MPIAAPGRKKSHAQAARLGAFDHEIDVVPVVIGIGILRVCAGREGGLRGIEIGEREIAVGVGIGETLELGERDGLDAVVALPGAEIEILDGLLAVEPVEELPRGVAEPEAGFSVSCDEEAFVFAHLEGGE